MPQTPRLLLRQWREEDFESFAQQCADATVMAYLPSTLTRAESGAFAERLQTLIDERGWGLWAVEPPEVASFIGVVGLHLPTAELPCSPCVEIGWRLAKAYWGQGYAGEAASVTL